MCFFFERQSVLWTDTHQISQKKKESSMFHAAFSSLVGENKTKTELIKQIPPY